MSVSNRYTGIGWQMQYHRFRHWVSAFQEPLQAEKLSQSASHVLWCVAMNGLTVLRNEPLLQKPRHCDGRPRYRWTL